MVDRFAGAGRRTSSPTRTTAPAFATPPWSTSTSSAIAFSASVRSEGDWQRRPASDVRAVEPHRVRMVHPVVGDAGVNLFQRDLRLHPGERGTEAEVGAVAEGEVALGPAKHVELLGGRAELTLVVVGGADEQQHRVAGAQRAAVTLDVAGERAVHVLRRVVEAQHLF